jgi:hypothetical protein
MAAGTGFAGVQSVNRRCLGLQRPFRDANRKFYQSTKSTKTKDERSICPHCEKELDEVKTKDFDKGKLTLISIASYTCVLTAGRCWQLEGVNDFVC